MATILSRKKNIKLVKRLVDDITSEIHLISEDRLLNFAYDIALLVKGRAVDIYFIAAAKLTNSILITNDRVMANNTKKARIEAYYLIEEFDKVLERIRDL